MEEKALVYNAKIDVRFAETEKEGNVYKKKEKYLGGALKDSPM